MDLEESITGLFISVLERLTAHVSDLTYNKKKIGLDIFIINFIGEKITGETDKRVNMTDIRKNLHIRPSTATRKVNYLVSMGLIERTVPESNRREVNLNLTEEGLMLYETFRKLLETGISAMLQKFSSEEVATFTKILEKLVNSTDRLISDLSL
ncbi:MAG: MarR family winged helix-turn-helix transcriptional regulator [Candidatus Odinarchaeota archaeon]